MLAIINHPVTYWLLAISWTLLVIIVLLKPGSNTVNHDFELSSFFTSFFSLSFSRVELKEALGHVILFCVMTILWKRALITHFVRPKPLIIAICIAIVLALGTETGQFFVNRGVLLLDLLANFLGIVIAALICALVPVIRRI